LAYFSLWEKEVLSARGGLNSEGRKALRILHAHLYKRGPRGFSARSSEPPEPRDLWVPATRHVGRRVRRCHHGAVGPLRGVDAAGHVRRRGRRCEGRRPLPRRRLGAVVDVVWPSAGVKPAGGDNYR
jgi:hypothetical protein